MDLRKKTAIISLYSINRLVFKTETKSVYCAVRAEYLNVIQINFRLRRVKKTWLLSFYAVDKCLETQC